jgi:MoaA/NifB/PqqE/SkfB family radical SAM enzyme
MQPGPRFLQIEPVGQCNLRCRMCAIQFRRDGPPHGPLAFLDRELFERLVDEAEAGSELHLQGLGEPMLHPRFFDMVRYAVARGLRVSCNTNATVLDDRRAEQCVTSGLHAIHVSLDGATAATYEWIRRRARFDRVVRNVARLVETRRRAGGRNPEVRMVAVVMRRNLEELAELVRLAHRLDVRSLFVQHLCHDFGEETLPAHYGPMRDFVEVETLAGEERARIERAFAAAREAAGELGVDLRLPRVEPREHPPGTPGSERCDWPWRGMYLSYRGEAMPCCMVSTPDRIQLGDAARDGLAAVWNGPAYGRFRAELASDEPPAVCRSCALYRGTF